MEVEEFFGRVDGSDYEFKWIGDGKFVEVKWKVVRRSAGGLRKILKINFEN